MQPLPTSEGQVRRKSSFPEDEKLFFFFSDEWTIDTNIDPNTETKRNKKKIEHFYSKSMNTKKIIDFDFRFSLDEKMKRRIKMID